MVRFLLVVIFSCLLFNGSNHADFRLQPNSPAATGAKTDFSPVFSTYTTLKGKVFTAPQPAAHFGAFPAVGD